MMAAKHFWLIYFNNKCTFVIARLTLKKVLFEILQMKKLSQSNRVNIIKNNNMYSQNPIGKNLEKIKCLSISVDKCEIKGRYNT